MPIGVPPIIYRLGIGAAKNDRRKLGLLMRLKPPRPPLAPHNCALKGVPSRLDSEPYLGEAFGLAAAYRHPGRPCWTCTRIARSYRCHSCPSHPKAVEIGACPRLEAGPRVKRERCRSAFQVIKTKSKLASRGATCGVSLSSNAGLNRESASLAGSSGKWSCVVRIVPPAG